MSQATVIQFHAVLARRAEAQARKDAFYGAGACCAHDEEAGHDAAHEAAHEAVETAEWPAGIDDFCPASDFPGPQIPRTGVAIIAGVEVDFDAARRAETRQESRQSAQIVQLVPHRTCAAVEVF